MKKLSYLLFLSFLILFSCSDDEDGDVNADGQIVLGGEEKLNLNHAVLEGIISTGSNYSFKLSFFDKEINYQNLTTELQNLEVYLLFNFFSPCSEFIRFGEFEYVSETEITNGIPEGGFFTVAALTRKKEGLPAQVQINKGTVSIKKEEGDDPLKLTVSFDVELKDGTTLTGEYSGEVEVTGNGEINEDCEVSGGGSPNDSPSLGEDTFELNGGLIADVGSDDTHYKYAFLLSSEAEINLEQEAFTKGENYIVLHLYSAGTQDFRTGTFNLFNGTPFANQNYMSLAEVTVDYDPANPETLVATLGSVEVGRVNNAFTLDFDLTLNNGKKLTGSYSGELPIIKPAKSPPILIPANEFTWDGVNHEIVDLYIIDFGPQSGHYSYDFYLSTKTNEEIAGGAVDYYLVRLIAFSWGNSSFSDGTFTMAPGMPVGDQSVSGKNYINPAYVGKVGPDPNAQFLEKSNDFSSGTINISRVNNNTFTIEFAATLDDGEVINGFYSGGFDIVEPLPPGRTSGRLKTLKQFKSLPKVK